MAELQSTDGSLLSQEKDEEKSLESFEDTISIIIESEKVPNNVKSRENNNEQGSVATSDRKKDDDGAVEVGNNNKSIETSSHRNGPTLDAIQHYIKSGNCFGDTLEDEEVSTFNSKIHRYTVERTRGRQGMYFSDDFIQKGDDPDAKIDPIVLTKEDIAQERMYGNIYQKEEFYAVATKFLKNVINGAQDTGGSDLIFHNKTASWLKRAAGMQRKYDPYERDDNQQQKATYSEDSDEGDGEGISGRGDGRRITRRRIRMTRKRRRLESTGQDAESFRILSEVAGELSNNKMGGKTSKKRKLPRSTIHNVAYGTTSKDIDESKADRTLPSLESTGLATIYAQDEDSNQLLRDREVGEQDKMEGGILPPKVARVGLEFRRQPLELEERKRTFHPSNQESFSISDNGRARTSKKVFNMLTNKHARRWAMHEFFYSDLDKEWYQKNGIASNLAKHGLPIDAQTQLTRQEWSLVRQKLRPRFRVFSKRFIAEQLKQRNRHRALLRKLQKDPAIEAFAPIAVGTPVSAISRHSHTIRRGRIMYHDPRKHCYLVQFDDKNSGCQICQDSEVADIPRTDSIASTCPSLYEQCKDFANKDVEKYTRMGLVVPASVKNGKVMDDVEGELLISSIAIVTEAFERKKVLLETLESCLGSSTEGVEHDCSKLLVNLDRINSTLETAQAYLQILYGKVFVSPVSKNETLEADIKKVILGAEIPEGQEFSEFMSSLKSISGKVGKLAFCSKEDGGKIGSSSTTVLQQDLSDSTSILLLSNYLAETSSALLSSGIEKTSYSNAINATLKILFDRFSKNCLPPSILEKKKLEQASRIEEELKDLFVAIGMLRAEVELATDESRDFELSNAIV